MSALYCAYRVEDCPQPAVPSRRMACADCEEPVWIDRQRLDVATREGTIITCLSCGKARIEAERAQGEPSAIFLHPNQFGGILAGLHGHQRRN